MFTPFWEDKTCSSRKITTGLTEAQSRAADLFTAAAVPGRSAALEVCGEMTTMWTSLPSPAHKPQPSSSQTCDRWSPAPLGAACCLMYQHVLELEALFEDHGACSGAITDSLVLKRVVHKQRALAQPLPTALQLGNRQKGHLCFPSSHQRIHTSNLDLTHVCPRGFWHNRL